MGYIHIYMSNERSLTRVTNIYCRKFQVAAILPYLIKEITTTLFTVKLDGFQLFLRVLVGGTVSKGERVNTWYSSTGDFFVHSFLSKPEKVNDLLVLCCILLVLHPQPSPRLDLGEYQPVCLTSRRRGGLSVWSEPPRYCTTPVLL